MHPAALRSLLFFGNSSASIDDSQALQLNATLDQFGCFSRTTTNVSANVVITENNVWCGLVGVFTNDSLRDVYVGAVGNTATNATTRAVANVMQFIRVGENFAGAGDFTGRIAEVAIWNTILQVSDIDAYMRQLRRASGIQPGNLIGYWPLSTANSTQSNLGTDAGGALTVTGAVFDADQPGLFVSKAPLGRLYVMP